MSVASAAEEKSGSLRRLTVLVNREGGAAAAAGDALPERIAAAFHAAGITARVELLPGRDMAGAVAGAARVNRRIVVAGGDGTVACAAQALRGSDTELALLPLGTLNHFSRDLQIPADLGDAAALAAHGRATPIDLGEVNGRCFINNASLGLYFDMVRARDDVRRRLGWPKWLAAVPAGAHALGRLRNRHVQIDVGKGPAALVTPLMLVGNNRYSLDAGALGARASLRDGTLSVYAVARRSRSALVWFAVRVLLGKADQKADFEELGEYPALTLRSPHRTVEIALDGELHVLQAPLTFRAAPGALRVVVPS